MASGQEPRVHRPVGLQPTSRFSEAGGRICRQTRVRTPLRSHDRRTWRSWAKGTRCQPTALLGPERGAGSRLRGAGVEALFLGD